MPVAFMSSTLKPPGLDTASVPQHVPTGPRPLPSPVTLCQAPAQQEACWTQGDKLPSGAVGTG